MPRTNGYHIRSQAGLFTWAQVDEPYDTFEENYTYLETAIRWGEPVDRIRIAREHHADGGIHYHAYVVWNDDRPDIRLINQFDFGGRRPNWKPKTGRVARRNACKYLEKEGEYVDLGDWADAEETENTSSKHTDKIDLEKLVRDSESLLGFLNACYKANVPSGYATAVWNAANGSGETLLPNFDAENDGGTIHHHRLRCLQWNGATDRKALVILGPTGVGKTVWARANAPKPALFVRHIDDLKSFKKGFHKTIIFDDMHFAGQEGKGQWPRTSQIHLVDYDRGGSIHCRYAVAYIPEKINKIFLGNEYMFTEDPAIRRRINVIDLF